MNITNFINNLVSRDKEEQRFEMIADLDGLNFILPHEDFAKCKEGNGSACLLHQYVCLQMLEEQGYANQIANGFTILSEDAVDLDADSKFLLELPPSYTGSFNARVNGLTSQSAFSVQIIPVLPDGKEMYNYQLKGPCLQFSSLEIFLLNSAEWHALNAVEVHHNLSAEEKNEQRNLKLIGCLQAALKHGMSIDLAHFNELEVFEPDKVGVSVTEQADGSLLLTPSYGTESTPASISKRLGQLKGATDVGTLRIREQIVVLDEKRLQATHEIISNRVIPKAQIKRFLETPTAFLDASLVDLDTGFSLRVRGATSFKHAYFGETDDSGIGWFEVASRKVEKVKDPVELHKLIKDKENLCLVEKIIKHARSTGATVVEIQGKAIDISDAKKCKKILEKIRQNIISPKGTSGPNTESGHETPEIKDSMVIDIIENDELQEYGPDNIPALIKEAAFKGPIDYSIYKRSPFPHQDEGIRWILGLAEPSLSLSSDEECFNGALLADDMGLGKTYMALVAVAEYYNQCQNKGIVERPVLVVVPLTLLEIWKTEIEQTFHGNPFNDVILLQADAHLKKFRTQGTGIEIRQKANAQLLDDTNANDIPENAIRSEHVNENETLIVVN